jgi:hypothetical protein
MCRITRVPSLIGPVLILTLLVGPASADLISVDTIPMGGLAFLENTDGHEFLVQVRNIDVTQANVQITKVVDPEVTNTGTDGEDKVDNAHLFDRTECLVVHQERCRGAHVPDRKVEHSVATRISRLGRRAGRLFRFYEVQFSSNRTVRECFGRELPKIPLRCPRNGLPSRCQAQSGPRIPGNAPKARNAND